jgi:GT2 family glycosyltransferase
MTERCIKSVLAHSPQNIEVLVTDNGSTDGSLELLNRLAEDRRILIKVNQENRGVSGPKREACERARAPYFVSLDNDAWVGRGWLETLRAPLDRDPKVMQVGRSGQHQSLKLDGIGAPGGNLEYIDGSCFMVRTEFANEIGLCDRYFPFAYGDDSDFSLRLRARGLRIETVDAPIWHPNEEAKEAHGGVNVGVHLSLARARFVRRWHDYLRRRAFDPTIAIRRTAALGDVVIASALPRLLHGLWPQSRIFFSTILTGVFEGNPHVEQVMNPRDYERQSRTMAYAWDLDLAYERTLARPYWRSFAEATVFAPEDPIPVPDIHVSPEVERVVDQRLMADGRPIATVCLTRTGWAGKDTDPAAFQPAVERLRQMGYLIVEVGLGGACLGPDRDLVGKTSIVVLAGVLRRSRVFLGLDSGPFHIAEAMGTPSVVVFGATSSEVVSGRPELLFPVRRPGLDCLGCHHQQPPGTTRFMGCRRLDLACMGIDPRWIVDALAPAVALGERIGR